MQKELILILIKKKNDILLNVYLKLLITKYTAIKYEKKILVSGWSIKVKLYIG